MDHLTIIPDDESLIVDDHYEEDPPPDISGELERIEAMEAENENVLASWWKMDPADLAWQMSMLYEAARLLAVLVFVTAITWFTFYNTVNTICVGADAGESGAGGGGPRSPLREGMSSKKVLSVRARETQRRQAKNFSRPDLARGSSADSVGSWKKIRRRIS